MTETPLQQALHAGDISSVRNLIAAGENIHYKNDDGYDAIIDAVHGPDAQLLEMLAFLIEQNVNLNGETVYGEKGDGTSRPVWCAQRFGQSITFLPDGRSLQIGGEHEDYYIRDFWALEESNVRTEARDGMIFRFRVEGVITS